jgi:hypothetical protein
MRRRIIGKRSGQFKNPIKERHIFNFTSMSGRNRSPTKADDPVDEAALGKYHLPFVAASRRHHIVAVIDY